ncbi:hypothetical protein S7711_01769 [Stachybotrys chartarum IBT 7711]|uniref:SRR1-like domain-containing protein n=1 Tax=Stachybotrys chartarum (strain CBS 109288 / IBT 7711) TaxID=1280523 RepID=A0A084AIX0_STACB|nr:hypothetical protein S7711_01769 [Stachybotrys chartarum IBT 7711]KFA47498.1 hypothetical protein S40293_02090 [Stachybotrys chartarum IBT 40293]
MPSDIDPSSNDAQHAKENAGWTYVKPKSRRRRTKPTKPSTHELPPQHSQPRSGPLRPLSAIDAEYRKTRSQWEGTSCCARLRELVATSAAGVGHVSNAICLGIGTFDPSDGAWEAKRRTFIQLIAFLIIVEELEKFASNKSIKCYFQEPAFTETDTLFIQSLDHQVVESPTGFDMVKDHSLLFGVHLYRPIYAAALRRSLPSIFVGTSWDVWDQWVSSEFFISSFF